MSLLPGPFMCCRGAWTSAGLQALQAFLSPWGCKWPQVGTIYIYFGAQSRSYLHTLSLRVLVWGWIRALALKEVHQAAPKESLST